MKQHAIISGEQHKKSRPIPLREALDDFILAKEMENLSPTSLDFYRRTIEKFIWWYGRSHSLDDISAVEVGDIRKFNLYLKSTRKRWGSKAGQAAVPSSDANGQVYYRALRAWFNWCDTEGGYLTDNPFRSGRLACPKAETKVIPSYDESAIAGLLRACEDGYLGFRDKAIILLLLDTGVRASELCGIKMDELERGRILIHGKGSKQRYVMLSPTTENAIRQYMKRRPNDEGEALFQGRSGESLTRSGLYQLVKRRAEQADLKAAGIHKFRHTFSLLFTQDGAPLSALQTLLGHATPTMSLKYGRMVSAQTEAQHQLHSPVERFLRGQKGKAKGKGKDPASRR